MRERQKGWVEKKTFPKPNTTIPPQLSVPFVLLFLSLLPQLFASPCLASLGWDVLRNLVDFGTEVPPPRSTKPCEPLLEDLSGLSLAGLSPPQWGAQRVKAAPLQPMVLWDVRAQGWMPGGQQSIPHFPRSTGRFTAFLTAAAAVLKSLFVPKVASRFARSGEKKQTHPLQSSLLKAALSRGTLGNLHFEICM